MKTKKVVKTKAKKNGRPETPIDWKQVENLLMAGCLGTEVAAALGIHPDTLYLRVVSELKYESFTAYAAKYKPVKKILTIQEKNEIAESKHKKNYQINSWSKKGYYIYVIRHGDTNMYKIGISKLTIQTRISAIQSGNPIKLNCIQQIYTPNASIIEKKIHNIFSKNKIRGEWFELSDKNLLKIKQIINNIDKEISQLKLL